MEFVLVRDQLTQGWANWNAPAVHGLTPKEFADLQQAVEQQMSVGPKYEVNGSAGADPRCSHSVKFLADSPETHNFAQKCCISAEESTSKNSPVLTIFVTGSVFSRNQSAAYFDATHRTLIVTGCDRTEQLGSALLQCFVLLLPDSGFLPISCSLTTGLKGGSAAI